MKYKVVKNSKGTYFEQEVESYLDNGWSLVGGIVVENGWYIQALIKGE